MERENQGRVVCLFSTLHASRALIWFVMYVHNQQKKLRAQESNQSNPLFPYYYGSEHG